jgi:hypothetical protein
MQPAGVKAAGKRPALPSSTNHKRQVLEKAEKKVTGKLSVEDKQRLVQRLTEMRSEDGFDGGWGEYEMSTFSGIPDKRTFVFPAHLFGQAMIEVTERRNDGRMELPAGAVQKAYMEGYKLWFSCGHEPREGIDDQLFQLTRYGSNSSANLAFVQVDAVTVSTRAFAAFGIRNLIKAQLQLRRAAIVFNKQPAAAPVHRLPVRRPPIAAAAAKAMDVVVEEQKARTPLLPVDRYGARKDFLKSPRDWHRFNTKRSMREQVVEQLKQGKMFAVGPARDEENRPVFRSLETTCGTPVQQFDKLIASIDFKDLLAKRLAGDRSRLPGLEYVGHGTNNSIWSFARGFNPTELGFPSEFFGEVQGHKMVLRVQTMKEGDRDLLQEHVAIDQMTNMVEAAIGEYGSDIYGIAWTRMMVDIHYQGLVPRYRVYTLMAKADYDLERSFNIIFKMMPRTADDKEIDRVFLSLLDTVWRYSVDHFVFIDAKPTNFVDFKTVDFKTGVHHKVKAIDLDYAGFRPIAPPVPGGMTQAWRPIWLYNILNMSVQLRMRVPSHYYAKCWWLRILPAIEQTLKDIHEVDAFGDDEEFRRAAAFVRAAKWTGDLLVGTLDSHLQYRPEPMPDIRNFGEPEQMAAEVVNIAKYYFVSAWYDRAYNGHVQKIRTAFQSFQFGDPGLRLAIRDIQERYVGEFKDVIPLIRHFKEQSMRDSPRLLVDVMYRYAGQRNDVLAARYMDGTKQWPLWPKPDEFLTQAQANSHDYWRLQLGLEFT